MIIPTPGGTCCRPPRDDRAYDPRHHQSRGRLGEQAALGAPRPRRALLANQVVHPRPLLRGDIHVQRCNLKSHTHTSHSHNSVFCSNWSNMRHACPPPTPPFVTRPFVCFAVCFLGVYAPPHAKTSQELRGMKFEKSTFFFIFFGVFTPPPMQ